MMRAACYLVPLCNSMALSPTQVMGRGEGTKTRATLGDHFRTQRRKLKTLMDQ